MSRTRIGLEYGVSTEDSPIFVSFSCSSIGYTGRNFNHQTKSMTIGSVLTFRHACLHNVETAKLQSCLWVRWFKTSNCIWVSAPFLSIPWRSDGQKDGKFKTLEFVLAEPPAALALKKKPTRRFEAPTWSISILRKFFVYRITQKNYLQKSPSGFLNARQVPVINIVVYI